MNTYSLLAGILLSFSLSIQAGDLKLWYKQPAGTWVEALPVGNSRMGAMVYGGTAREELQLNDETMWGGSPYRNDKPEALARKLLCRKAWYALSDNRQFDYRNPRT